MKKLIISLFLFLFLSSISLAGPIGFGPISGSGGAVSNDVYNLGTWNGSLLVPTQNSLRDYFFLFDTNGDGVVDNVSGGSLGIQSKSFVIYGAIASDDFLIWRTPVAITITHIHGVLQSGTNVVGGLDECDEDGLNPVAVGSDITFNGGLDSDDGSLTNPTIAAGNWIKWHTTSVSSPGYLTVTIYYTID